MSSMNRGTFIRRSAGALITVLWDKSGIRYGKGAGLRVFADGQLIASGAALTRVTGKLP